MERKIVVAVVCAYKMIGKAKAIGSETEAEEGDDEKMKQIKK